MKQRKCPICKCWFNPDHTAEKYCSAACQAEGYKLVKHQRMQKLQRLINDLVRKECYFKWLDACHGERCVTMRNGFFDFKDKFSEKGISLVKMNELASIIMKPGQLVTLCRHHFMMWKKFFDQRPGSTFDDVFLHVLDKEKITMEMD